MTGPLHILACVAASACLSGAWIGVAAQEVRDPMVAPADVGAPGQRVAPAVDGSAVVVRDGKPYLVVDTRLYAPGDRLGNMRIERITESEIVLRDGTTRIVKPRFAGIERKTVVNKPLCGPIKPAAKARPARQSAAAQTRHAAAPASSPASQPHRRKTKPVPVAPPCEDTLP